MKTKEMQQGTMRCVLCPCRLHEKSKVNGWSKKNPKTAVKGIKHKKKNNRASTAQLAEDQGAR